MSAGSLAHGSGKWVVGVDPAAISWNAKRPPGPQDSSDLPVEARLVFDVHADVLHKHDVERLVGTGQVERAAPVHMGPVPEAGQPVQEGRARAVIRRHLDAVDTAFGLRGDQVGRAAETGADIEDALAGPYPRHLEQFAGRAEPAGMEMVERPELLRREPCIGVESRRPQPGQDPGFDITGRVMRIQCRHGDSSYAAARATTLSMTLSPFARIS
ncbi:MAG: hypothetical protein OEW35_12745 [Gammaproteobacteria bacterium]|nr:hypothetical protein [Gammaproteobacteria bacterium]MDH4255294.1 hypothetical protein [Gammaproteobacteria bacterium]MDH5310934.1 hypothetical protein [Gammaproteobacteria bacterium]